MSTGAINLVNACPACGAEEALDVLIARMIDDDQVRGLIAQVLTSSFSVGGLVVRYLRLHKPAKQRLRMSKAREILAELVPDITRGAISRKGREWAVPMDAWRAALEAVLHNAQAGSLTLPLDGNAYLYEVAMRQADQAEGQAERERLAEQRSRREAGPRDPGAVPVGAVPVGPGAVPTQPAPALLTVPAPQGPSLYARKLKAELEARRLAQQHAAAGAPDMDEMAGLATTPPQP